ncbi:hypothetical protein BP6252_10287 [Coleophoma cylindrospora]|uniref:FAD dependent oxidoreductase domain-containing protein n=1 Tax=Coleophoma cylindrospora TaxID=1849047 RepID=A0A3D8QS34_9HELO|nr:hypothetical protein BP6252_10287 [Coleophoma cylindrospora]
MTKVTIVGAGISGMAVASQLPKNYQVTIVARDLPGDPESLAWSSPWAGAVWMGMADSSPADQKMQLEAFAFWWKLAASNPESSVRRIEMIDLIDGGRLEDIWYRDHMPDFRVLSPDEMPEDATFGISYQSIVLQPMIFLPWLRKRLEANGVVFQRQTVTSLRELAHTQQDVIVNCTGVGSRHLTDVHDAAMEPVRGQTVLVKSGYNKLFIRRGKVDYTYALSRLDGTVILGGIKQHNNVATSVDTELRRDIFRRIAANIPAAFPSSSPDAFEVVRDIVGIRPQRSSGTRVESEVLPGGVKVVHAYGPPGGAYIWSMGMARRAVELVHDFVLATPVAKL